MIKSTLSSVLFYNYLLEVLDKYWSNQYNNNVAIEATDVIH